MKAFCTSYSGFKNESNQGCQLLVPQKQSETKFHLPLSIFLTIHLMFSVELHNKNYVIVLHKLLLSKEVEFKRIEFPATTTNKKFAAPLLPYLVTRSNV